jgi:hypothetical protein
MGELFVESTMHTFMVKLKLTAHVEVYNLAVKFSKNEIATGRQVKCL